jgi:protein TonB
MRWSMLPVSAAVHAAVFVMVFFNAATGGDLPTPWPIGGIEVYIPVVPTPPEVAAAPVPPDRLPTGTVPIEPPDGIREEEPAVPPNVPVAPGGLPSGEFGERLGAPGPHFVGSPSPPAPEPERQRPTIHRVGGAIREPRKIVHVPAAYPEIARNAKIEGLVIIEATIDQRGLVTGARVLRSVPLLDAAALAALKQWRYTPTLLNNVPVPVLMTITFNFKLGDRLP